MKATTKVVIGALVAVGLAAPIALWIWLDEDASPETVAVREALNKAGCEGGYAFDLQKNLEAGPRDPSGVRYDVKCTVLRPMNPPTCESVLAAYRAAVGAREGDVTVGVELMDTRKGGHSVAVCSARFAPDGRLVEKIR